MARRRKKKKNLQASAAAAGAPSPASTPTSTPASSVGSAAQVGDGPQTPVRRAPLTPLKGSLLAVASTPVVLQGQKNAELSKKLSAIKIRTAAINEQIALLDAQPADTPGLEEERQRLLVEKNEVKAEIQELKASVKREKQALTPSRHNENDPGTPGTPLFNDLLQRFHQLGDERRVMHQTLRKSVLGTSTATSSTTVEETDATHVFDAVQERFMEHSAFSSPIPSRTLDVTSPESVVKEIVPRIRETLKEVMEQNQTLKEENKNLRDRESSLHLSFSGAGTPYGSGSLGFGSETPIRHRTEGASPERLTDRLEAAAGDSSAQGETSVVHDPDGSVLVDSGTAKTRIVTIPVPTASRGGWFGACMAWIGWVVIVALLMLLLMLLLANLSASPAIHPRPT